MAATSAQSTTSRPLVGVSSCLLGQEVRFDGGHKLDKFVRSKLGEFVDYVPECPEVAIGLGIPRAPIRLSMNEGRVRVIGVKDPTLDVTDKLDAYAHAVHAKGRQLAGYVFKKGSPSCGMERVKIYTEGGMPLSNGSGRFAHRFMELNPLMPCEEDGRLNDMAIRESFVERVFTLHRWQRFAGEGLTPGGLVDFHTRHKYLILSHSEVGYRQLGRMVAEAGAANLHELCQAYIGHVMQSMRQRATRKRHANVLQHLLGFLSRTLESADRKTLNDMVDEYRLGKIPLVVPIRFLRYHFARQPNEFVSLQYYLHPYPEDLGIRNQL
ncbi:MAG: hypothetical protein CMQ61_09190 [Gammaproteobacteria bacterium]|nr:hypothetical protein [Gammaproteobacteria bacterium]